jgi:hypothetical protein
LPDAPASTGDVQPNITVNPPEVNVEAPIVNVDATAFEATAAQIAGSLVELAGVVDGVDETVTDIRENRTLAAAQYATRAVGDVRVHYQVAESARPAARRVGGSVEKWLTDTATILRRAEGIDAHGQASGDWVAVATDVPCCRNDRDGRRIPGNQIVDGEITVSTVYMMPGVDVRKNDRLEISGATLLVDAPVLKTGGSLSYLSVAVTVVK